MDIILVNLNLHDCQTIVGDNGVSGPSMGPSGCSHHLFFGSLRPFNFFKNDGSTPKSMPQSLMSRELEMYRNILGKTSIVSECFGGSHALVGGRRS